MHLSTKCRVCRTPALGKVRGCIWLHSGHRPSPPGGNILWWHWNQKNSIGPCTQRETLFDSCLRCWQASWVSQKMKSRHLQRPSCPGMSTWGCEDEGPSRWEESVQGCPPWWWGRWPGTPGTGDLQPWEICESCENKLCHQSHIFYCHIWPVNL